MHEKQYFAEQNVPWKMDEEASPAGGCGTRSLKPGSWSDWPRNGTDSSGVVLPTFLRVVLLSFATQLQCETLARSFIAFCTAVSADRIKVAIVIRQKISSV
jgi:hypothetical protein